MKCIRCTLARASPSSRALAPILRISSNLFLSTHTPTLPPCGGRDGGRDVGSQGNSTRERPLPCQQQNADAGFCSSWYETYSLSSLQEHFQPCSRSRRVEMPLQRASGTCSTSIKCAVWTSRVFKRHFRPMRMVLMPSTRSLTLPLAERTYSSSAWYVPKEDRFCAKSTLPPWHSQSSHDSRLK